MNYKVTYPLITQDGEREFETLKEAETFANERRNIFSRYQTNQSWRMVKIYDHTGKIVG